MIRRYGDTPETGQRYRLRAGVYAILPRDGALLVTWQGEPHDELQLPGGGIDPHENPLRALHREVFEETGWSIARPRRLGAFRRFTWMPEYKRHAEKLCHVYVAHPVRRLAAPTEPNHTALWVDPGVALDVLANDGDAAFLRAWLSRV
ncbi:8-oxo-dGTP diphosphatase [Loktanella fryxellensis]|uniref:8-oxo-dGTP diphosphatase n=1 Tax=Loktanella fryxellensis TaxID=245187 RepID=A0A1H8DW46_9RHOB|nr:NUDIX hydrolase [Loktanella fryxellensis]SEN11074.1 8-oxo-dGTP diphosphatase [Loktanella fryxellensis]